MDIEGTAQFLKCTFFFLSAIMRKSSNTEHPGTVILFRLCGAVGSFLWHITSKCRIKTFLTERKIVLSTAVYYTLEKLIKSIIHKKTLL